MDFVKASTELVNTVSRLQQDNLKLRDLHDRQSEKLERAIIVIKQLIVGLFNNTQEYESNLYISILLGTCSSQYNEDNVIFTTGQGDLNDMRLTKLEEKILDIESQIIAVTERQKII
jgi:hypothetical protein